MLGEKSKVHHEILYNLEPRLTVCIVRHLCDISLCKGGLRSNTHWLENSTGGMREEEWRQRTLHCIYNVLLSLSNFEARMAKS